MSVFVLDNALSFPPVHMAEPDGLLAIGGDLSTDRLLLAYRKGIFPWYEGDHILWWSPDPRFILVPGEIHISKSMKSVLKKDRFEFTIDQAFKEVIHHCKKIKRYEQGGTWITDEVEKAYIRLYEIGHAHSAEAWLNGKLVGGLYGVRMGRIFFGESMFSTIANASKFAFIKYAGQLEKEGIELIDCQVYTTHLESLGARMISRNDFIRRLDKLISATAA